MRLERLVANNLERDIVWSFGPASRESWLWIRIHKWIEFRFFLVLLTELFYPTFFTYARIRNFVTRVSRQDDFCTRQIQSFEHRLAEMDKILVRIKITSNEQEIKRPLIRYRTNTIRIGTILYLASDEQKLIRVTVRSTRPRFMVLSTRTNFCPSPIVRFTTYCTYHGVC